MFNAQWGRKITLKKFKGHKIMFMIIYGIIFHAHLLQITIKIIINYPYLYQLEKVN